MTSLFASAPPLRNLNQDALRSPKVTVINADALQWLEDNDDTFDFVVVDFPDPSNFSLGKLYSAAFYRLLDKHLNGDALAVIQSTSPLYARQSFWCIVTTLESVGHFLLGGFQRLVEEWSSNEPGRNRRDIAQKALDAVAGVDLNPFAVAIARFRLLLAALQVSDVH